MFINPEFKNGDIVELICGREGNRGMVILTCFSINQTYSYVVSWGDRGETSHVAAELKLVAVTTDDLIAE